MALVLMLWSTRPGCVDRIRRHTSNHGFAFMRQTMDLLSCVDHEHAPSAGAGGRLYLLMSMDWEGETPAFKANKANDKPAEARTVLVDGNTSSFDGRGGGTSAGQGVSTLTGKGCDMAWLGLAWLSLGEG